MIYHNFGSCNSRYK